MLASIINAYTSILKPKAELTEQPTWMHLNLAMWWLLTHDFEHNWFAIRQIHDAVIKNRLKVNDGVEKLYQKCKEIVYSHEV